MWKQIQYQELQGVPKDTNNDYLRIILTIKDELIKEITNNKSPEKKTFDDKKISEIAQKHN